MAKESPLNLTKLLKELSNYAWTPDRSFIDPMKIAKKVIEGIYDGITTGELDQLAAETAAYLSSLNTLSTLPWRVELL